MLPRDGHLIYKIILAWAGICFCAFPQATLFGAEYTLTPGVTLRETYDDNVLLKEVHDLETRISPSLELLAKTEKTSTRFLSSGDILRYRDNNDLDRVNQNHGLDVSHAVTPVVSLNLSASLGLDHTFETELEESGIVAEKERRSKYSLSPGVSVSVNELNTLQSSLSFSRTDNEKEESTDNTVSGANLAWNHAFKDRKTTFVGTGGVQQTKYDFRNGEGTQRVYSASCGVDRVFSEIFSLSLRGGMSKTSSSYDSSTGETEEDKKQFDLDAEVKWALERSAFSFSANRGITQSVYDENITREKIAGRASYNFTDRISSSLVSSYTRSKTEGVAQEKKTEAYSYSPSLEFQTSEDSSLRLSYVHTYSKDKIKEELKRGNKYMIQFSIKFPQKLN